MAASMVPESGISLHGAPTGQGKGRADSILSRSAIVVNLNEQAIRDLQQCSQSGKTVQLLGGKFPRIRYGSKTLDLSVRPETFRHEIYSADKSSAADLAFTALVSHQAEVKSPDKKVEDDTAGPDAALAMLKQSLASAAQEKEARKVTISNTVIASGKNSKSLHPSRSLLNRAAPTSWSNSSTPHHAPAPTSAPLIDAQARAKEKAMRTALIHLLAVDPATEDQIFTQTRIPRNQLTSILTKIAEKERSEWKLSNKTFKELDPWNFKYKSDRQRQSAIDNAIRAYDRLRIPKEDKSWQVLLSKEDRGKGKVLSRLQLNVDNKDTAGPSGLTPIPSHATPNSALTPKLGPSSSTPRSGATTATGRSGAGISMGKMLKDAKKQRAVEEAKMKKAQQKEAAAASDRESKPKNVTAKRVGTMKRTPAAAKSEEIVRSSDDEDEGEVIEKKPTKTVDAQLKEPVKTTLKPRPVATERRESSSSDVSKPKAKSLVPFDSSSRISNVPYKSSGGSKLKAASKPNGSTPAVRKSEDTTMATKVRDTVPSSTPKPTQGTVKNSTTSQINQQKVSPKKADTKPKVPSPLGTVHPIQAADRSGKIDKPSKNVVTKGVKVSGPTAASNPKPANKQAENPLSFFGGIKTQAGPVVTKKRALDSADEASEPARKVTKTSTSSVAETKKRALDSADEASEPVKKVIKTSTNGTSKPMSSSRLANTDNGLKARANDISSTIHDHGAPTASKHRKTDTSSTHSLALTNSSVTSLTTAATASPSPSVSSSASPHDSAKMAAVNGDDDGYSSTRVKLTYAQALDEAEKFRTKMYPVYLELYERLDKTPANVQSEEDVRKLWEMHGRLSLLKKEIFEAAE